MLQGFISIKSKEDKRESLTEQNNQFRLMTQVSTEVFVRDILVAIYKAIEGRLSAEKVEFLFRETVRSKACFSIQNKAELPFDIPHSENIDILVESFCPEMFSDLCSRDGVSTADLLESVRPNMDIDFLESQGKSSSFFVSTSDNKFLFKTLKRDEVDFLLNDMLYSYYFYVTTCPDTFLCPIYGVFKVYTTGSSDPHYILLMRNLMGEMGKVGF